MTKSPITSAVLHFFCKTCPSSLTYDIQPLGFIHDELQLVSDLFIGDSAVAGMINFKSNKTLKF